MVVADGLATGDAQVLQDSDAAGDQTYDTAPVAFSVAEPPVQITALLPALTTGRGFTVTVTFAEFEHPAAEVPVTV